MKVARMVYLLLAGIVTLSGCCTTTPSAGSNGSNATMTETGNAPLEEQWKPHLGAARAIVVVKLKDDKPKPPDDGPWQCRLIHKDPELSSTDDYERHVNNGDYLLLVNHSNETVTFTFRGAFFDEGAGPFTVEPDFIKLLTVKEGIVVKKGDSDSAFQVNADEGCLDQLPGPYVFIP